jgi:hypothetical protein
MSVSRGSAAAFFAALVIVAATSVPGAGQMPDPKQMSGLPLPVNDVPPGTVTVRVIRGALTNPVAGHEVQLVGPATGLKGVTNESGRAEFPNLPVGTRLKALTTVDGEPLESQEFSVPSTGGVRLMLVASDPETAKHEGGPSTSLSAGPAQPGIVVLGDQSRFVFEFNDDGLSVFNIFQIVNTARTPVQPPQPVVFDLPDGAEGAAVLQDSSPQASVAGRQIKVAGPFAPGATLVQFAYTVEYSGGSLTLEQKLPVGMTQFAVLAQKVGNMHLQSPQMAQHRDMTAEGQRYVVGQGPAIKAGEVVSFNFTGLPHAPLWPRNVALAIALVVLGAGAWGSLRHTAAAQGRDSRRRKLEANRELLFDRVTALEEKHRAGGVDARQYAIERRDLVAALERVYAELDEEAAA